MAQIVLISEGTYKEGLNNIGDVASVHDDDVALGPSYASFKVISLPGTAQEVVDLLNANIPQTKTIFRSKVPAGEWTDERPEEATAWDNGGTWQKVEAMPKYQVNIAVDETLENAVKDTALTETSKLSLVGAAATSNIATMAANATALSIVKAKVMEEAVI